MFKKKINSKTSLKTYMCVYVCVCLTFNFKYSEMQA